MHKLITILLCAAAGVSYALAQSPGGLAQGPGNAPAHSQAAENANAPQTGTQKRGHDRAQERRDGNKQEQKKDRDDKHRDSPKR